LALSTRKRIRLNEKALSRWWSGAAGACVQARSGATWVIRYPGMLNGSGGPDYLGAVLDDGRQTLLGDVELHVRSSDWTRHHHGNDHAYDSVVLHVVLDDDGDDTTLANGVVVPIALASIGQRGGTSPSLPCGCTEGQSPDAVLDVLETAGMVRLLGKGKSAAAHTARMGRWSATVCLVARALGFISNAGASESTARCLVSMHDHSTLAAMSTLERQALVLGVAGLLPSQRTGCGPVSVADARIYERCWRRAGARMDSLRYGRWNLAGAYPNNHPVRRMVALADILPRIEMIVETLVDVVSGQADRCPSLNGLVSDLVLEGDAYWRGHYDFGAGTPESSVVGCGKAREIAVNALFPMALAMAAEYGGTRRLARLFTLIRDCPPPAANAVTRHMRGQLGLSGIPLTAVQIQGLLHLFKTYCTRGHCLSCPLGAAVTAL